MSEIDLDTAAQNIYTRLSNAPTFHPAGAALFTDWNVQAGDIVTVGSGEESYSLPICSMKLKWTGQSKVDIESTGNPERKQPPARERKAYRSAAGGYGGQKATNDVLHDAGLFVDPTTGVWAYASEQGEDYALGATFSVQARQINSKVSDGEISSTLNQTPQAVLIQASKINLSGYVTVDQLQATNASITNLTTGVTQASVLSAVGLIGTNLQVTGSSFTLGGQSTEYHAIKWTVPSSLAQRSFLGYNDMDIGHYHTMSVNSSTGVVTLGAPTADSSAATFNIADTAFYQQAVSAATANGWSSAINTVRVNNNKTGAGSTTIDLSSQSDSVSVYSQAKQNSSADVYATYGTVTVTASGAYGSGWSGAIGTVRINNSKNGPGNDTIDLTSGTDSVTVYSQAKQNSSASTYTTYGTVTVTADGAYNSVTISRVQYYNSQDRLQIYNDSEGNLSVKVYVSIANGKSGTYTITVPYRCID